MISTLYDSVQGSWDGLRPASASVRFLRKFGCPPSEFVLEADGVEENLLSAVLHRPTSASVPVPRPLIRPKTIIFDLKEPFPVKNAYL